MIKLSDLKKNPNNPRLIKDDKFQKLVKSIENFPKMMELRPIIVNDQNIVLGGNMRLAALKELGYKEIPNEWVKQAKDLTQEQQNEFIVKDNVSFGENDWDILANEWDSEQLVDWGLDVPIFLDEPTDEDLISDGKKKPPILKITFESPEQLQKAEIDIQELIDRKYKGAYFSVSAGEL
jgi:hypothetical protein